MRLARAGVGDVWAYLLARNWHPPEPTYRLLLSEALQGRMWVCFASHGEPVALGGALPGSPARLWLDIDPAAGSRLLAVVRAMREVILHERPGRDLACIVRDDNETGRRLATLLGFSATEQHRGPLREWRLAA